MKEKIIAALKVKYPGLQPKGLAFFAEKILSKVTVEADIAVQINELENGPIKLSDYATFHKSDVDSRVAEAVSTNEKTLKKKFKFVPIDGDDDDDDDIDDDPEKPAKKPVRKVDPAVKKMQDKLDQMAAQQKQQAIQEKLAKLAADEKIPGVFIKGRQFDTEEEMLSFFEQVKTDYAELKQDDTNDKLKDQTPPPGSEGYKGNIKSDIENWVKQTSDEEA